MIHPTPNLYDFEANNPLLYLEPYSWLRNIWEGVKQIPRALLEPALMLTDIGQAVSQAAINKITGDETLVDDVPLVSATGQRLKDNMERCKGARSHAWACFVTAAAAPTGGGSVVADNIDRALNDDSMTVTEKENMLQQGAAAQVAATGLGVGLSKVSGRGLTGRGQSPAPENAAAAEESAANCEKGKCGTEAPKGPPESANEVAKNTNPPKEALPEKPSTPKEGAAKAKSVTGAESVNSAAALNSKLSALETAQQTAARTRTLGDGRIRYYGAETPASNPGPTRGASYVTEWDPKAGTVRSWMESYDQAGNVCRVHPKMINGQTVVAPHYPPTGKELGL